MYVYFELNVCVWLDALNKFSIWTVIKLIVIVFIGVN